MRNKSARVAKADQSSERVNALVEGWRNGVESDKTELVRVTRPIVISYVRKVAVKYPNQWDDLEQTAWEGIIEAVHTFDDSRGVKFWTWATWRMRKHVSIWMAANSGAITLPYPAWQAGLRIDRFTDEVGIDSNQMSDEKLAEVSGTGYGREILAARNVSSTEEEMTSDPWKQTSDEEVLELFESLAGLKKSEATWQVKTWCFERGYSQTVGDNILEARYADIP